MPTLNEFISKLDAANELIRVKEFLNPKEEISEVADRLVKHNGPAILVENNGTNFPVLINVYGTEKRMCMALGVDTLDDTAKEIKSLFHTIVSPKKTFIDKLKVLPILKHVSEWMPVTKNSKGECQDVINLTPDLSALPVLTCWPFDGGPFITLPLVHTIDPNTGIRNTGMYRMQIFDKTSTGMHWHRHKGGAAHFDEYKKLNKQMPVSVALGGDPIYTYTACAPLPENIDEYMLAGFLRKKKVTLVKCITNDIYVPADADIIIEGYIDTNEPLKTEGPFGDHTGFYSLADNYPVFHVTCITHRKNAVYPTTIVGIPPMEDAWLGKTTERIFLPLIQLTLIPELVDMTMPVEGVFHNIVIASFKKTYPGQANKVMHALWGAGQMMFNKILIVVDETVDVHNYNQVVEAIKNNVHITSDLHITKGPLDVLDHASNKTGYGSKLGIDATSKLPEEEVNKKNINFSIELIHALQAKFNIKINTTLLVKGLPYITILINKSETTIDKLHNQLLQTQALTGIHACIYIDSYVTLTEFDKLIWYIANNIEPLRDISIDYTAAITCIDATRKTNTDNTFTRGWPNVIASSDETIQTIDDKWNKLNIGTFITSPSLHFKSMILPGGASITE